MTFTPPVCHARPTLLASAEGPSGGRQAGRPALRYNPVLLVAVFAMSADQKTQLADLLRAALLSVAPDQAETPINLERPKQAGHGDFASNLALQLVKPLKRNPRELANLLLAELPKSGLVAKAEVAGAGSRRASSTHRRHRAAVSTVAAAAPGGLCRAGRATAAAAAAAIHRHHRPALAVVATAAPGGLRRAWRSATAAAAAARRDTAAATAAAAATAGQLRQPVWDAL